MQTIENTPRREDDQLPFGEPNTKKESSQNNPAQQQQASNTPNQQQGSQQTGSQQAQQNNNTGGQQGESEYRGQGGQEYDVDADDAVNHQADYSGNSERDRADASPDRDMESQHDSDQNINPGDKAPNKDFNR
ncbi:hypothetical protein [Emticicia sp. 17c]|uniref:hypothetical protein n=1 Tax=Emticicia sp. 17c TaxID=3127704 RepID=UPI00301C29AA